MSWNSQRSWNSGHSWSSNNWQGKRSQDWSSQNWESRKHQRTHWENAEVKEEDWEVTTASTPSTPLDAANPPYAMVAPASHAANPSFAQVQAMMEKVAQEKREVEKQKAELALAQQKAELEQQRAEVEQQKAELEQKKMASTKNHAKLPETADSTAVHSDDLSGQHPAGWEVRGFFHAGLNGLYERSDKDYLQVRGTCPRNGYYPTPTYWNRQSPKESPVFFHWQYTKDRYVVLPMYGAEGQDHLADVLRGQYGEGAKAMGFYSPNKDFPEKGTWFEYDESIQDHAERAIKYTPFWSKNEIPPEDMLPAGTGVAVVAPRRMLCARTPVPGQSPGTPTSMLQRHAPGTPKGTLPGTPKGVLPGTPKGAAPGTPTGAVPGTPRKLPGTNRADGLQDAKVQKKEEDDDNEIAQILDHAIGKSPIEKKEELFDDIHNTTNTWKEQAKAKKQKDDAKKEEVKEEEKEEKTREMKLSPVP